MNLRDLALTAPAPPFYRVTLTGSVVELRTADGAVALGDPDDAGQRRPLFRSECSDRKGDGSVIAHIAVPMAADLDIVRQAGVSLGKDGRPDASTARGSALAVEAGLVLLRDPQTGQRPFTAHDRAALLQSPANGLAFRLCHAALTVYQVAASAGNVSASPTSEATTGSATDGASPASSG